MSLFGNHVNGIYLAAFSNDAKRLKKLLEKRPIYTNKKNASGWTALHYSAYENVECISVLLSMNANHLEKDNDGKLPIHISIIRDNIKCLREFLLHANYDEYNLLHYAAKLGKIECVRFLLEWGMDKHAKNDDGKTPSYVAKTREIQELIDNYGDIPHCKHCLQ